jgi:hypothetical protein
MLMSSRLRSFEAWARSRRSVAAQGYSYAPTDGGLVWALPLKSVDGAQGVVPPETQVVVPPLIPSLPVVNS